MKTNSNLQYGSSSLLASVLVGGGIGLLLMSLLLFDSVHPEWGPYWKVRPLVVITIVGALGGAGYHLLHPLRNLGGWKTFFAYILSILGYIIALWLGSVLGLVGTLWN